MPISLIHYRFPTFAMFELCHCDVLPNEAWDFVCLLRLNTNDPLLHQIAHFHIQEEWSIFGTNLWMKNRIGLWWSMNGDFGRLPFEWKWPPRMANAAEVHVCLDARIEPRVDSMPKLSPSKWDSNPRADCLWSTLCAQQRNCCHTMPKTSLCAEIPLSLEPHQE